VIPGRSRKGRFYGWTALAGVMLAYFGICGNLLYSYGVFLPSMSEEFGWSRVALSAPFTMFWIAAGFLGPVAGISISKFGARKNIILGNLVAVLGLLGMSIIQEVWHVYLFFGVLIGLGLAFGEFIANTTIVNDWFIKRRSLAMSLVFTAGGVGGFLFPPLISWLISSLGWRLAWVSLAGIHTVLAVAVAGILIRNKPEEIGQVPDGEVTQVAQGAGGGSLPLKRVYQTPVGWKVGDALRTRALWLVLIFEAAAMFTLSILQLHQVAYLQGLGFSPMMAATTLGLLAGASIVGRLVCGILGTRFEGRYLAAAFLALFIAGIIILINVSIKTLPLVYLYAALSGISFGGMLVLGPILFGAYFGRTHYARIVGWTAPVITSMAAASPLLAGFIYDVTGSYVPAFWVAVVFLGVGVVCALLARPPKPPETMFP